MLQVSSPPALKDVLECPGADGNVVCRAVYAICSVPGAANDRALIGTLVELQNTFAQQPELVVEMQTTILDAVCLDVSNGCTLIDALILAKTDVGTWWE